MVSMDMLPDPVIETVIATYEPWARGLKMQEHFSMLSPDEDKPEEDIVATLLGVIGYSAQSIEFHPDETPKFLKHMRSEANRVKEKIGLGHPVRTA